MERMVNIPGLPDEAKGINPIAVTFGTGIVEDEEVILVKVDSDNGKDIGIYMISRKADILTMYPELLNKTFSLRRKK